MMLPPTEDIARWPIRFARIAAGTVLVIGTIILLRWIFYFSMPDSVLRYFSGNKPNEGICMILAAIALWLKCENNGNGRYKLALAEISAAMVLVLSLLTLLQYFFNINIGIDDSVFRSALIHGGNVFPLGRMSPLSATNFALLSFSLLFMDSRIISYRSYHVFSLLVIGITFLAFLIHIYKIDNPASFLGIDRYSQMTMENILACLLLGLGILFARPWQGIVALITSRESGSVLARRLIPPAIILPVFLGYLGLFGLDETIYTAVLGLSLLVMFSITVFVTFVLANVWLINKKDKEQKGIENALKLNQEQFQAFLDNTNNAISICDTAGKFLLVNRQFEKIFHPSARGIVGKTIREVFPAELAEKLLSNNARVIAEEKPIATEESITFQEHERIYFSNKFPLYHEDCTLFAIGTISTDVTRLKHIQKVLKQSKENAENLAREADQANKAKSTFLAAMSHEIRSPLNGVIGMTSLLLDTPLSAEQKEYVETIRLSGEALLSVIKDILDFSKIESAHMDLENVDFDLHNLVEQTVEIIAAQAIHKPIFLGALVSPDVPRWLTGDSAKIAQVLTNILSNAVKFTEQGEITVRVKVLEKRRSQNENIMTLLFEVIDSGIGISSQVRSRLFQPFSQGDSSTSRKYGGTGLGLSISRRLVELMSGSLDVSSDEGKGSNFWFTVKLNECVAPINNKPILNEIRNIRLLCVDNIEINREIVGTYAQHWQIRCDLAENEQEAIARLKSAGNNNDAYQVIIIGLFGRDSDRLKFVKKIRQLPGLVDTRVILLVSLGAALDEEKMQELQINQTISIPLRVTKLYDALLAIMINPPNTRVANESISPIQENTVNDGYRILLAEDNIVNQQVCRRMLEKLGLDVDVVPNGVEAIRAFTKRKYHVVLMDCQMPEKDGYTTAREIREIEAKEDSAQPTIIIALTAHAMKEDKQKCLDAGMNDYLTKPLVLQKLKNMLDNWLSKIKTPESKTSELIDMQHLHLIFGADQNSLLQFVRFFIENTGELLEQLQRAIDKKDAVMARKLFHQLKGSAGNAGVMTLHALAESGETAIAENHWEKARKLHASMCNLHEQLNDEFVSLPA